MTSKEAIIYQLKSLKGKPFKQKLEHIIRYFWIPIVIAIGISSFAISYIVHIVTTKPTALSVTCINAYADNKQTDAYVERIAQALDIDLDEYEVKIATNMQMSDDDPLEAYTTAQALISQIAANTIDVMIADPQMLSKYIYQDVFCDLTQVLPLQKQAQYEGSYLYMDMAFLRELQAFTKEISDCPDPMKPELMREPVAVALLLPLNGELQQFCYAHVPSQVAVGIVANSANSSNAMAFLDHIMNR